jgi:hypothetical protein
MSGQLARPCPTSSSQSRRSGSSDFNVRLLTGGTCQDVCDPVQVVGRHAAPQALHNLVDIFPPAGQGRAAQGGRGKLGVNTAGTTDIVKLSSADRVSHKQLRSGRCACLACGALLRLTYSPHS